MAIITLLSDWGLADHYVGAVKGRFYCEWPQVCLVDISHQIPKYNSAAAAYVLKQAYPHFPPGSVHCIGVNDIATPKGPHVIIYDQGHYFIGAVSNDNGIFRRLFDHKPEKTWKITHAAEGISEVFPSLNLFPMVAVHLAQGGSPDEVGEVYEWPNEQNFTQRFDEAYLEDSFDRNGQRVGVKLTGNVIYIDSYGNGVTNIGKALFEQALAEFPRFDIQPGNRSRSAAPLSQISRAYHQVPQADLCALFLDNQLLEISLRGASAAQLYQLRVNDAVIIKFKP